jgi:hypothetical protein
MPTKHWADPRWNNRWLSWGMIPVELRAALTWAFLTSGPQTKEEFEQIITIFEQWRYSVFSILLELEIKWMHDSIKQVCCDIENIDIYRCISLFFGAKPGGERSVSGRFLNDKKKQNGLFMLENWELSKRNIDRSWEWMDEWYFKTAQQRPCFTEWVNQELESISNQKCAYLKPSNEHKTPNKNSRNYAPLLHLGRCFPIGVNGQEIQKTIRSPQMLDKSDIGMRETETMIWGYILHDVEPGIPYDPFPTNVSNHDPNYNLYRLSMKTYIDSDAYIGGRDCDRNIDNGLIDFPLELRLAADTLRRPNRPSSPMSHLKLI